MTYKFPKKHDTMRGTTWAEGTGNKTLHSSFLGSSCQSNLGTSCEWDQRTDDDILAGKSLYKLFVIVFEVDGHN